MKMNKLSIPIKMFTIQSIFILLHYLYDWFPNNLTTLISGINESIFQHMKIGFFSYVIFMIIELVLMRKRIPEFNKWFYSRMFSCSFFPLAILILYLIGPLVWGKFESIAFEVIFANVSLLLSSFVTLVVEEQVEKGQPGLGFRFVVIGLFVVSLLEYVVFTFEVPWFDIFAIPPGY